MDLPVRIDDLPRTIEQFDRLLQYRRNLPARRRFHLTRVLARYDLFFLLTQVLSTATWPYPRTKNEIAEGKPPEPLFYRQWFLDRCREIQFDDDRVVDIWARFSAKTTIKSFARLIQRILQNPNITIGLFSLRKPDAVKMLSRIKNELTQNELLKRLFPDILYPDPEREAPKWSEEEGFIVRRTIQGYQNATIEPVGLLKGAATGSRFSHRHYDDVIGENDSSPEMSEKAWDKFSQTQYQRAGQATESICGTFYFQDDVYQRIVRLGGRRLRIHPCWELDRERSEFDSRGLPIRLELDRERPVLFSKEYLDELRESTRPSEGGQDTFPVQMECDFNAALERRFRAEDFLTYDQEPVEIFRASQGNIAIVVDPANEKNRGSCFTSMWVVKAAADQNYYILDGIRARLGLTERGRALMNLHKRWSIPGKPVSCVGYEKFGMQADIEYIEELQKRESYRFVIHKLQGYIAKDSRIEGLLPLFNEHRIFFPRRLLYTPPGEAEIDIVRVFREEEYLTWPSSKYKDGLDSLARILDTDLPLSFPRSHEPLRENPYAPYFGHPSSGERTTWFSA